jgi:hypothetical protein
LAEAGAAVAVLGRNDEKNQRVLSELKAIGVPSLALKVDLIWSDRVKSAMHSWVLLLLLKLFEGKASNGRGSFCDD